MWQWPPDGEQILYILGGLGQDYDPAACAVTSRFEPWSIGDVSSFLLRFESRMETTRAHSPLVLRDLIILSICCSSSHGKRRNHLHTTTSLTPMEEEVVPETKDGQRWKRFW